MNYLKIHTFCKYWSKKCICQQERKYTHTTSASKGFSGTLRARKADPPTEEKNSYWAIKSKLTVPKSRKNGFEYLKFWYTGLWLNYFYSAVCSSFLASVFRIRWIRFQNSELRIRGSGSIIIIRILNFLSQIKKVLEKRTIVYKLFFIIYY